MVWQATQLLSRTGARALVFLGDLLHARHSHAAPLERVFGAWRAQHAQVAMTLVRGNHDDRAGDPVPQWAIRVVDEPLVLGGLVLITNTLISAALMRVFGLIWGGRPTPFTARSPEVLWLMVLPVMLLLSLVFQLFQRLKFWVTTWPLLKSRRLK